MNAESRVSMTWPTLVVVAAALLGIGAGLAYLGLRPTAPIRMSQRASTEPTRTEPAASAGATAPMPDLRVTLSPEAVKRAGVTTTVVSGGAPTEALRVPAVVEANAYRQVAVTPLVAGRVTRVMAELGQQVRQGETIAQIFSPELAESQTRYVSARAELAAHEQELARMEKLMAIGATSRQDLERAHAEHTARLVDLESAASRLQLLGLSGEAIAGLGPGRNQAATIDVPAPLTGVVTARAANVGLNVDPSMPLLTIIDLSSVWVMASVHEKDVARVRVGSPATVTTDAARDEDVRGRVSYIDPQVSPETRTVRVRIEVPNTRQALRLGMFAEVLFIDGAGVPTPLVPRGALQNVGNRSVVYLADPQEPGTFVEREVQLGPVTGDHVSVLGGVRVGDRVVGQGSFAVRAELDRLGLRRDPARGPR